MRARTFYRLAGIAGLFFASFGAGLAQETVVGPFWRVPRLAAPPTLDGRIGAEEWAGASAVTGLVLQLNRPALAPPELQAVVWMGYDDRHLFVAARVPNVAGKYPIGRTERPDAFPIWEEDRLELRLAPGERARAARTGEGFYRIAVNPLGAVADRWINSGRPDLELLWSSGGGAGCRITPEAWEIECSVAWDRLGVAKPDGQVLFAQFGLMSGGEGAPLHRGWADGADGSSERWGELRMDPAVPAVQWLEMGAPGDGRLDARIEARGLAPGAALRASFKLKSAGGATLFAEMREMKSDARGAAVARWSASGLPVDERDNVFEIEAVQRDTVLYRRRARADRWTEALRDRHLKPWLAARSAQPPAPAAAIEDEPRTVLAFLSAQRQRLQPLEAAYAAAQQAGDREAMAEIGRRLIAEAPFHPLGHVILAAHEAARFNAAAALDHLEQAVDRGFNNTAALNAAEFQTVRDLDRFRVLAGRAAASPGLQIPFTPAPAEITRPIAEVAESNTALHPQLRLPVALYRFASAPPAGLAVTTLSGEAGRLLNGWQAAGTAAGNWGDLYDNRDGGHSRLPARLFPQLTHIRYAPLARRLGLDSGLATTILQNGVLIGNASLAVTAGPAARSMPRLAHANPPAMALFHIQYRANQLYVHPAHMDYPREPSAAAGLDPARRDVFFANAPYPLISRGSSGTDQPHLEALAATLAAFRPDTKTKLRENGLLMPTLQMLLRRHYAGGAEGERYLTARAHPVLFAGAGIGLEAMVRAAQAMTPDALPPWAEIRVEEEERPAPGRDFFEVPGRGEEIFTTPAAVARIFRGTAYRRRYLLSAEQSHDANGRPLVFHWRLLQGDPARVTIRPRGERGERAEIEIAWHPPFPAAIETNVLTARVDLALFAHNGAHFSAPAFFTVYFPPSEERTYAPDGRVLAVRYGGDRAPFPSDTLLYTPRAWRDEYAYDAQGRPAGWTRTLPSRVVERYDAAGRRRAPDGTAREVSYRLVSDGAQWRLEPAP